MTGTSGAGRQAYVEWTEHRFFRYRGCAPDPDAPGLAVGSAGVDGQGRAVRVPVDAWLGEDRDGGEPQKVREARQAAAVEVCLGCPVMVQCDAYASTLTPDGRLVEPEGIRGGRTALERHRALIKARQAEPVRAPRPAPDRLLDTKQKRDVLAALAVCWEPVEVMVAAGMPDVRTANWQRSALVRLLGLPKTATRMQVLEAARARGRLDGVVVVADDGTVPAIPPATEDVLMEVRGQVLLWPSKRSEVLPAAGARHHRRRPGRGLRSRSLRSRFRAVPGQTELEVAVPSLSGPVSVVADVVDLFADDALAVAA
jgi:hypothetical protein